jgi:pilus assembly protein Flp/PilA
MLAVASWILTNWKREDGQTMAEYGVILAVIAVIAVGAFELLGGNISNTVNSVANSL